MQSESQIFKDAGTFSGALESWKAKEKWQELGWWQSKHGQRTVPLEVGAYNSPDWQETVASFSQFEANYLAPSVRQDACQEDGRGDEGAVGASASSGARVAYLAQHRLFDQIPELLDDIQEPELWSKGFEVVNMWMGTRGTVCVTWLRH